MLCPPPGQQLLVVIDDVNLPIAEAWGSHPPIELLRQCIDSQGLYDKQGLYFKSIEDIICIVAAAPPGGGRSSLTQRFTRYFAVLNVLKTSEEVIETIFG